MKILQPVAMCSYFRNKITTFSTSCLDSLVAMACFSRKNLRKCDIQSQNEVGRKDDDAYYATDGSL